MDKSVNIQAKELYIVKIGELYGLWIISQYNYYKKKEIEVFLENRNWGNLLPVDSHLKTAK